MIRHVKFGRGADRESGGRNLEIVEAYSADHRKYINGSPHISINFFFDLENIPGMGKRIKPGSVRQQVPSFKCFKAKSRLFIRFE
jgi:hypothetical protein